MNAPETEAPAEALTAKEKVIHEQGLVSVLKQIHDDLDAAVFDAYGWPHDLRDEQILERLVALNLKRAEEEKGSVIRWLRPEFQAPKGAAPATQPALAGTEVAGEAEATPRRRRGRLAEEAPRANRRRPRSLPRHQPRRSPPRRDPRL